MPWSVALGDSEASALGYSHMREAGGRRGAGRTAMKEPPKVGMAELGRGGRENQTSWNTMGKRISRPGQY